MFVKRLSYVEKAALLGGRAKVESAIAEYNRLLLECGLNPSDIVTQINWETGDVDDGQPAPAPEPTPAPAPMNRAERRRQAQAAKEEAAVLYGE